MVFVLFNAVKIKIDSKLTLHYMGKVLLVNLLEHRVTCFKDFYHKDIVDWTSHMKFIYAYMYVVFQDCLPYCF